MFEILQEISTCDTGTRSEQMLLENGTDRLSPHKVTTSLQLVKKHSICEAQQKEACLYFVLEAPVD